MYMSLFWAAYAPNCPVGGAGGAGGPSRQDASMSAIIGTIRRRFIDLSGCRWLSPMLPRRTLGSRRERLDSRQAEVLHDTACHLIRRERGVVQLEIVRPTIILAQRIELVLGVGVQQLLARFSEVAL